MAMQKKMRRLLNITLSAARIAAFSLVIPFSITVVGTFFLEYSGVNNMWIFFIIFFVNGLQNTPNLLISYLVQKRKKMLPKVFGLPKS